MYDFMKTALRELAHLRFIDQPSVVSTALNRVVVDDTFPRKVRSYLYRQ